MKSGKYETKEKMSYDKVKRGKDGTGRDGTRKNIFLIFQVVFIGASVSNDSISIGLDSVTLESAGCPRLPTHSSPGNFICNVNFSILQNSNVLKQNIDMVTSVYSKNVYSSFYRKYSIPALTYC